MKESKNRDVLANHEFAMDSQSRDVVKIDEERALRVTLKALRSELSDILFSLSSVGQRLAYEKAQWGRLFGEDHLAWMVARDELLILRMKLALVEEDPSISDEELDDALVAEVTRLAEEQRKMREEQKLAPLVPDPSEGGFADPEYLAEYARRIKEILLEIHLWCHAALDCAALKIPARLAEEINEIWLRTPGPKTVDLTSRPGTVGYELPDLGRLLGDHSRLEDLLDLAGVPVKKRLEEPKDLDEAGRLDWLEKEIGIVQQALERSALNYSLLVEDPVPQRRRLEIAAPEAYEKIRQSLKNEAEGFEKEAQSCRETLASRKGGRS